VPNLTNIAVMPIFAKIGVASLIPDVDVEPFVTVVERATTSPEVLAAVGNRGVGTGETSFAV